MSRDESDAVDSPTGSSEDGTRPVATDVKRAEGTFDYRLLFEDSPDVLLVLLPDSPRSTMVAVTDARLRATHTTREQTIGHGLFELFPDNPDDPGATGVRNLRASLERVLAPHAPDSMAVQKYDIRMTDGSFQIRYWSPKNLPVFSPSSDILYIFHRVEDVTDLVRSSELGEELKGRTRAMEREVLQRSRELADANRNLREYLSGLLVSDYDVTTANDGLAALEENRARKPDIVVSDVMMPRLDGFGLVRELRADASLASVPVILLSARAGEDSAIEGLDAGSDDYLAKPFSARELLARVRTHVEMARARRAWILELEHINRELESFSYSVSHDLRAPLRAIDGFSRALLEDCADQLDDEGKKHLKRVRDAVTRMGELIEDLLVLSRVARSELLAERVDLTRIANDVGARLQNDSAASKRQVEFRVQEGLAASGDARLLRVVLENLLRNAWKYTGKVPRTRVEVGVSNSEECPAFYIRDNGAGFDMEYASKLFVPFQRLHDAKEYEGHGIGLATVQRIIRRHGGRIWAEGQVGQGATFYFTLGERNPAG